MALFASMFALLPNWLDPKYILDHYGDSYGGWIVLAIIFAECGLFLFFLAGFFSAQGKMWAWYFLLPALFVAAFAGDQLGYFIGSRVGPALFDKPDARFFKQKYVHTTHQYLEERGSFAIPIARFVPVDRGRRVRHPLASLRLARRDRCAALGGRRDVDRPDRGSRGEGSLRHRQVPVSDHRRHHRDLVHSGLLRVPRRQAARGVGGRGGP